MNDYIKEAKAISASVNCEFCGSHQLFVSAHGLIKHE